HSRYVNRGQCKGGKTRGWFVIRISNIMEYFPGFKSDAANADSKCKRNQSFGRCSCRFGSTLLQFDRQTVVSGLNMGRKLRLQPIEVEIGMQVGQDRPRGFDAF